MNLLISLICLFCLGCADQYEGDKESEPTSYSIVAADPTLGIAKPHHHYSPWDLNDDGIVNIFDLIIVANHFGEEVRFYTVITRVIDGDTVVTEVSDKIRYLGIDTPERGEPFYNEAVIFNRDLVEGKKVRMEFERDEVDGFGRVLAYLFADDGRMVNEEMVLFGLAVLFNDAKGLKYQERLKNSLVRAQDAKKGMWGKQ